MPKTYKTTSNNCNIYYTNWNKYFCSQKCRGESFKGNSFWKLRNPENLKKSHKVSEKLREHCKQIGFKKGHIPWFKRKEFEGRKHPTFKDGRTINPKCIKCNNKISITSLYGRNICKKCSIEKLKELNKNPEFREKILKAQLKGLFKRPTSLENQFIRVIETHKLPFNYVGDGSFLIGWKNPDFINTNGQKICIEVANHFHHPDPWTEKRIEHFAKWGWKCLVFFGNDKNKLEIPEEEIIKNINGASNE